MGFNESVQWYSTKKRIQKTSTREMLLGESTVNGFRTGVALCDF